MVYDSLLSIFGPNVKHVVWLGAVSFERRCTGSVEHLLDAGLKVARAVVFDYPTKLVPQNAGEQQRSINRERLKQLLGKSVLWKHLNPYRYTEFVGEIDELYRSYFNKEDPEQGIIFDITCLTKIHTLALAYWLLWRKPQTFAIAYSQPAYYGNPSKNIWGKGKWHSPVLVRLGLDSTDRYLSTHAIVLVGHEGDRLRLALNEITPNSALIIKPLTRDPDSPLAVVSNVQNQWLYSEIKTGLREGFTEEQFHVTDLANLRTSINAYCERSKLRTARIVLCPFGPKPFVFVTAMASLTTHPNNTWLSYPIPFSYDPDYSEGFKYTLWLDPSEALNNLTFSK